MAQITAALVKELRDRTGAGMGDCKKALEATGGDINAAIYEGADMVYNAIPIQIAVLGACGGYGRAA